MFSLLPEKYKKSLKKEYALRRWIVTFGFVGILATVCIILYVPFFVLAQIESSVLQEKINQFKSTVEDESGKEFRGELNEIKKTLNLLNGNENEELMTELFSHIIEETGSEIRITNMTYRASDTNQFEISIAGVSSTRDALRAFGKRLEGREVFESVNLPVSNFAQNVDIRFALTIKGHEK